MKELLAVISLLVSGAVTEAPSGPYPASGWKPSGPAFDLPQPGQSQQLPVEYLPPVEPRNPPNTPQVEYGVPSNAVNTPAVEYGPPQGPNVAPNYPQEPRNAPDGGNLGVVPLNPGAGDSGSNNGQGFPQNPSSQPQGPGVGLGGSPGDANTPGIGIGGGIGIPQGNGVGPGVGIGAGIGPQGPGVGIGATPGFNNGPGIGIGGGIGSQGPGVDNGPGIGIGAGIGVPQGNGAGPGIGAGIGVPQGAGAGPGLGIGAGIGVPQGNDVGPGVGIGAGIGSPQGAGGLPGLGIGAGIGVPQGAGAGPGLGIGAGIGVPQGNGAGPGLGIGAGIGGTEGAGLGAGIGFGGFGFNAALRNFNPSFQQNQYDQQQQNYREFQRQRQLEALIAANRLQRPEAPAVFASRTTPAATEMTTQEETTIASTTDSSLNEGEVRDTPKKKEKVTVELSAQKIQEYPGEFFLSSLAQLQLQPEFNALQFDRLKAPLQSERQTSGFDAQTHFAALPSIIAQQNLRQSEAVLEFQPVNSYQQPQYQVEQRPLEPQGFYSQANVELLNQYQPQIQVPQEQPQPQFQLQAIPQYTPQVVQFQPQPAQYQPQPAQYQPQPAQFPTQPIQFQPQPASFQPQPAPFQPQPAPFQPQPSPFQPQNAFFQPQPDNKDAENIDQMSYQPQIYQQQFLIPQSGNQPEPNFIQGQLVNYPGQDFSQFQGQFQQQNQLPPASQGADALQSGLDINQQGNDIDEPQDKVEVKDEGNTATAVATAFGTRTQPRVIPKYGTPFSRAQADKTRTTTESPAEDVTDDGPVVAHAVAIADGTRKKSGKLRRSRLRPIFTLDKSGHLVLAQGQ